MSMFPKRSNVHVADMMASPRSGMKAEAQVYESLEKAFGHDGNVACLWSLAIRLHPVSTAGRGGCDGALNQAA